jgi:hypothetical protein
LGSAYSFTYASQMNVRKQVTATCFLVKYVHYVPDSALNSVRYCT